MAGVVNKFFITSLIMWAAPIAILYAFNHNLIPGELSLIFLFGKSFSEIFWYNFFLIKDFI